MRELMLKQLHGMQVLRLRTVQKKANYSKTLTDRSQIFRMVTGHLLPRQHLVTEVQQNLQ